jgi:uncharacterized protein
MTPDEIRKQLEDTEGLPEAALAAAVAEARALAPAVIEVVAKAADGVFLLPRQARLLLLGLHALAAARETSACPAFLALLRRPEATLDWLLGFESLNVAVRLLLSLYDGDDDVLFALVEDRETEGLVRWAVFQVLARLAWEGRVPHERVVALIDRFDREEMAPANDLAWLGWADAIRLLGLRQFEERVQQGERAGRLDSVNDADRQDYIERLAHAVDHPDDPQRFIDEKITPITDPVEALHWLAEPATPDPGPEPGLDSDLPTDPAEEIKLSVEELSWLDGFLNSEQVPETTIDMEMLDGLMTALVAGPELVLPSEYMPHIWGSVDGGGPIYDGMEQAQFVTDLITRHWNTIARRLDADHPHAPVLSDDAPEHKARHWTHGFLLGLGIRPAAWEPMLRHEEAGSLVASIAALIADEIEGEEDLPTPEFRAEILENLPAITLMIRKYWRDDGRDAFRSEPIRSTKIGRNEPCPCGSGKKYKKCCGGIPSAVH